MLSGIRRLRQRQVVAIVARVGVIGVDELIPGVGREQP
jgi:hypothetical protein